MPLASENAVLLFRRRVYRKVLRENARLGLPRYALLPKILRKGNHPHAALGKRGLKQLAQ